MSYTGAIAGAIAALIVVVLHAGVASADDFTSADEFAAADTCPGSTAVADDRAAAVSSVLCLVNNERAVYGMNAVRVSTQLTRSAEGHSLDMTRRKYFSHFSPEGGDMRRRVLRSGYVRAPRAGLLGETITWGSELEGSPAELIRSFMNSPGHRRVILDGRYRDIGIGIALAAPFYGMPGASTTLTLHFGRR